MKSEDVLVAMGGVWMTCMLAGLLVMVVARP